MRLLTLITGVLVFLAYGILAQEPTPALTDGASTRPHNSDGEEVGQITFSEQVDHMIITAQFNNLPPGFHGFHIHTVGSCEDSGEGAFSAAGGHFNPDETSHPDHAGDLPSLLVLEDGSAFMTVTTDRLTIEELMDEDGSAVIIHANAENFANIPERYGEADEETLKAGDAGERIACGVISQGGDPEMIETVAATP